MTQPESQSMIESAYYKMKTLVRPITQHRRLLERARYIGIEILGSQEGNDLIASTMDRPAAVGKIGSGEMAALRYYLSHADVNGECNSWGGYRVRNLYRIAGVYPPENHILSRFCQIFSEALTHLDVLGVWFNFGENSARRRFAPKAVTTHLDALEPYYNRNPWIEKLAGKRVLVVSPFAKTIEAQYPRRGDIWRKKSEVLPEFQLRTLQVPLSAYLLPPKHKDWIVALDNMRAEMAAAPFDAALVGAGAWSLPLVAHAKSLGTWSIHLGGTTQLLFGIKGRRWENNDRIMAFQNEAWVRPASAETPQNSQSIEGGCYW